MYNSQENNDIYTIQEHIFGNNEIENSNLSGNITLKNSNLSNIFNLSSNILFPEESRYNLELNYINDSINDFNDKLNEYRNIEHKILVQEDKSVRKHILLHLENEIEMIEKNFEKITHKQFDKIVNENEEYNKELNNELEKILGFSLDTYNKKSVKIELSINEICSKINNHFQELQNNIYNLHILNYKMNFISTYETEVKKTNVYAFYELVDIYEKNIKKELEEELNRRIKSKIEEIHKLFNMLKILQSQLYVKVVTKYSCGICLINNIDSYYNNCRHVICKSCGIKNRNNNICPFCKRDSVLKNLFFI